MLLALLLAAATPAQAPAKLHVPKRLREERAEEAAEELQPLSVFETPEVLAALGPLEPRVGAWAEYAVRTRGAGAVRVKFSILPPALEGGRYWLEMDLASEMGAPTAVRMLVHGSLGRPQDLEAAQVYVQGQAPLEVPLEEVREGAAEAAQPPPPRLRKLGTAAVQVPAGRFDKAELTLVAGTRLWRSPRVPLWGLVRSQSREQTVELIGYAAAGAHTLIQGNGSESVK